MTQSIHCYGERNTDQIIIDKQNIEFVDIFKYLSVRVANKLTGKCHVECILKKLLSNKRFA